MFLFLFLFERWVAECNLFTLLLFSWVTLFLLFSCSVLGGIAARIMAYGPYDCPDFLTERAYEAEKLPKLLFLLCLLLKEVVLCRRT